MATCETQSYARDFADDPQILAEARLYVSPYDGPDATLQDMIGAALTGEPIQSLFPNTVITLATERFLRGVTLAEIGLARTVLAQWDLFGDIPGLMGVLGKPLEDEQRLQFSTGVEQVVSKCGDATTDIFLRRLNGEPKRCLAADYHVSVGVIRGRLNKARSVFSEVLADPVPIYASLEATFPKQRRYATHTTQGLPEHIASISDDITELGRRTSVRDLEVIGHTLGREGLGALAMHDVLQYVNSIPWGRETRSKASIRGKRIVANFPQATYKTLQSLRIRSDAQDKYPVGGKQEIYENTDEATKLIYEVLSLPKQAALSKQEQSAAAKDIEIGVYAEKKKQELLAGHSPAQLSAKEKQLVADLDTIIATGHAAMRTLLNTHRPLVDAYVRRIGWRTMVQEDLVLAGTRGLLRAIRKYDYQHPSNKRFTNYAIPWVRQYMWRYIFKNVWKVGSDSGVNILRIFSARTRLKVERAIAGDRKEVRIADIAADIDMPPAEVEKLLLLHQNAREDTAYAYDDNRKHQALDARPMATTRMQFAPHVQEAFSRVLIGPHTLQVLELHIAADLSLQEIARITSLPLGEIPRLISTAIDELTAHFDSQELFALLKND